MTYSVIVTRPAQRAIDRLPPQQAARVFAALRALAIDPRPVGCVKLADSEDWRIRVGNYRIIYKIDDKVLTVTVFRAGHRRDVYR